MEFEVWVCGGNGLCNELGRGTAWFGDNCAFGGSFWRRFYGVKTMNGVVEERMWAESNNKNEMERI